jgi:3-phosphoshikimate 1-carboxyvinyltransferase
VVLRIDWRIDAGEAIAMSARACQKVFPCPLGPVASPIHTNTGSASVQPLISKPAAALTGSARVPGDKSISHRALMLGALAIGETEIEGLLAGEDVMRTAAAMRALGAEVDRDGAAWRVWGRGVGGLVEPEDVLDLGNAGTAARLLLGVLASHPLTAVLTGDASLRARPMARVVEPLEQVGARVHARAGCRLPLAIVGTATPMPIRYRLPVPSAQVKSAVLLAGLNAPGTTTVEEPAPTRDHSERMLRHFGAEVESRIEDGGRVIALTGQPELTGRRVLVPADPSSAAFPAVAALLRPGSRITLPNVDVNPLRIGLFETLREMGAKIEFADLREQCGEPVADLVVEAGSLEGIEVPAGRAPSMIDEYPVLAVAAALAKGRTVMHGLAELRVKESDRLTAMAEGLAACGVGVAVEGDTLIVDGTGAPPPGGAEIAARLDHRIAMSFLVLGLASRAPITIDDGAPIETSFPGFAALMNGLGAAIEAP